MLISTSHSRPIAAAIIAALLIGALLIRLSPVSAASGTWQIDSNGDWNNNASWGGAAFPNATNDIATFGSTISAPRTVTINNATVTTRRVELDNANAYSIVGSGAGRLTLDGPVASPPRITVTQVNGAGNHSISAPATIVGPLTINTQLIGTLTVAGKLSGTGSVTKEGFGLALLSGDNSYTGNTVVNSGTLALGSDTAVGAGTLTLNNTAQIHTSGGPRVLANLLTLGSNTTVISGSYPLGFSQYRG